MRRLIIAAALACAASPAFAETWGAIDCTKAKAPDEKAICASTDLVQRDAVMSTEFGLLKGFLAMGGRGALQDEQKEWLTQRAKCGADASCLRKSYDARMAALEAGLERVKSRGPF